MSFRALARTIGVAVTASALTASVLADGAAGQPTTSEGPSVQATNGIITSNAGNSIYAVDADGIDRPVLASDAWARPAWSPDGSRFVYGGPSGLMSRRADGSGLVQLADQYSYPQGATWSPDGSTIVFSANGDLRSVPAGGGWTSVPIFPDLAIPFHNPTFASSSTLLFDGYTGPTGNRQIHRYVFGSGGPTLLVADGHSPAVSPDGTKLAYTVGVYDSSSLIMLADIDGSDAELLVGDGARDPAWSPDGSKVLFSQRLSNGMYQLNTIDVGTGVVTPLVDNYGLDPSWQPVDTNYVERVWGQDHVDTAIGASQAVHGDNAAGAVVLSRDDTYLDALVGSALAVNEGGPLLVTNRLALDPRVEAEINRVLPAGGLVYVLGGELAIAPAVVNRLSVLGYQVLRVWGQTHFDTALEINRRITPAPHTAIVTTGINFYDALAAGAAAGANPGTVIVLTDGVNMPASSAAYLNSLNPDWTSATAIVTAGGPGDAALRNAHWNGQLPNWGFEFEYFPLVGLNEMDTAVDIAEFFFAAPSLTAVATNVTWFDALTGGAMIGSVYGPLLITTPGGLYGGVRQYLSDNAGNLWSGVLLGGTAALPAALQAPIGEAISLPGQWEYLDHGIGATRTTAGGIGPADGTLPLRATGTPAEGPAAGKPATKVTR